MPKKATFRIGRINVISHPHSPERYSQLFLDAASTSTSRPTKIRGDTYGGIFTAFNTSEGDQLSPIEGSLIQFTHIDPDAAWIDMNSRREATSERVHEVEEAISGLAPNARFTRFIFDPLSHQLFWISHQPKTTFTANAVLALFKGAFSAPNILARFGQTSLVIQQSEESLEEIWGIPVLQCLTIKYVRPNPDGGEDFTESVAEEMEAQGVLKTEQLFQGSHLLPNPRTKALGELALSNGHVEASGLDDSRKKVKKDTRSHPWTYSEKLDPNATDKAGWLRTMLHTILERIDS